MSRRQTAAAATNRWSRRRFLRTSTLATGATAFGFPNLLHARGANERLQVGFIGLGGMGSDRLKECLHANVAIAAFCDVDDNQLIAAKNLLPAKTAAPKCFTDYRALLAADLDAVVIATPDHWHAPLARAALLAGKHVFCEKPLTHTLAEARDLRELSRTLPALATQLGNQGSASPNLRRAIELIQAGVLGAVREVHVWVAPSVSFQAGQMNPTGEDPVPTGLHWDHWIGPAPLRAFKKNLYHPRAWRAWYDFGGGSIADWGCHGLNLPVRALQLHYPTRIAADVPGGFTDGYPKNVRLRFEFAARDQSSPVTLWWYDGGRLPPAEVIPPSVREHFGEIPAAGVLILGEHGFTYGDPHLGANYLQLTGEKKLSGILNHAATKSIARTLPRSPGHVQEWINACGGGAGTFSNFETGGKLTEIVQAGTVAVRAQTVLDWDGDTMRATNLPSVEKFVRTIYRKTATLGE